MLRAKCSRFRAERPDQKRKEGKKRKNGKEKKRIFFSLVFLSLSLPWYFSQFLIMKHSELSRCSKRSNLVDANDDLHDLSDT